MILHKVVRVLLVGRLGQGHLLPQVWCQVCVGLRDGGVCGLCEVTQSACGSSGRRVTILDTGHLQQLLGYGRRYDTGTTGGGNQSYGYGTTFSSYLEQTIHLATLLRYQVK